MSEAIPGRFESKGRADFMGAVAYAPIKHDSATDIYIDWEYGNRHVLTLTSDVNIYLVNPYNGTFHLLIEQQGDWVVTWKVNDTDLPVVAWPGGTEPYVSGGGSEEYPVYDVFSFSYWEDKGIYMAMATQSLSVP